jgi:hypothetical protein
MLINAADLPEVGKSVYLAYSYFGEIFFCLYYSNNYRPGIIDPRKDPNCTTQYE